MTINGPPARPPDAGLERLVACAREDLAHTLRLPLDRVEVLEARAVTWPDPGLGCGRPGMRYKQVPTDGALIRLRAGGREYEYHSGGGRGPFLCEPIPGRQRGPSSGAQGPAAAAPPGDAERM